MQGRFGTHQHRPVIDWDWPRSDEPMSGVELLEQVAADYAAAGTDLPIGGYVDQPYLPPGEVNLDEGL